MRDTLGGQVFDILGEAFDNISLKNLLVEAIRYGERPETRAQMDKVINGALDVDHIKKIIKRNAFGRSANGIGGTFCSKRRDGKS